jgi:hypothetical protein
MSACIDGLGKVAILEGLIHSVAAASSNISSRRSAPAIVAAVVVAVLSICSNVFIRHYFYEAFLKLHLLRAGALFITLWFHTKPGKVLAVPKICNIYRHLSLVPDSNSSAVEPAIPQPSA